jgi:hypothetical protein
MINEKYNKLLEQILKAGKLSTENIGNIQKKFIPISITRNSVLEEQDKIPKYLYKFRLYATVLL